MYQDILIAIKNLIGDELSEIHTALPGTIQAVDYSTGRATVLPAGRHKVADGRAFAYPSISGVPLVFPTGAAGSVGAVFPVKQGDGCLLIIAEQALDAWLYGGQSDIDLKHDLTNAIAIPGLFVEANKMLRDAASTDAVIVYAGENQISISAAGITLKGDVTVEGGITASGDVKSAGVSLSTHRHTAYGSGETTSGPG